MPHATRPGDVLADRYRLVDLLSESGDGRFWRAHDRMLERHVAVHVIRADDDRVEALMAAARRSATVLDPRILRVLDADITDKVCYVVNEWGWGASLDIVAAGTGPLGPRRAAWLVSEVADSIATAHRAGVAHGRLNPENVLIDRSGRVRIIGLCVDAALHGAPDGDLHDDVIDLAGLLYCALTARWGGQSGSAVTPAPLDHGEILRPRRVRAGIPRPLDALCEEILHSHPHSSSPSPSHSSSPSPSPSNSPVRHRESHGLPSDARGVADYLADFVGDPTGMAVALLASTPPVLPDEEPVVLPQVPDLTPFETAIRPSQPDAGSDARADAEAGPDPEAADDTAAVDDVDDVDDAAVGDDEHDEHTGHTGHTGQTGHTGAQVEDLPTEAGLPIFGPDGDDVSWLERRATPAPPPPPFESPPERPLFAPEPAEDESARRARQERQARQSAPARARAAGTGARTGAPVAAPRSRDQYWPWDTSTGAGLGTGLVDGQGLSSSTVLPVIPDDHVPGRSWFRL
ncbi:protein kinase family protein, partial [Nocardioides sp.]|uniref:protein kinase family protein n=1 Tax=Nocardioides sp. TaxID=35761 RepID=UPI002B2661FB